MPSFDARRARAHLQLVPKLREEHRLAEEEAAAAKESKAEHEVFVCAPSSALSLSSRFGRKEEAKEEER